MVKFLGVIFLLVVLTFPALAGEGILYLNSGELKQGELLVLKVETTEHAPTGTFRGVNLHFIPWEMGWVAFFGISYWTQPGDYQLKIHLGEKEITRTIVVLDGDFSESHLTVSEEQEKLIRPSEEDKEIIERRGRDQKAVQNAYSNPITMPLWEEDFILPTTGWRTTGFGHTRYVNNKLNNRHSGIDIANEAGTPIKSVNQGKVKLAEDLLVTGKTIIIDHGGRIFSSYSHLSKIEVVVGDMVERGQKIGEMGSTGFSTGPHLHWVIRTPEAFLDPDQFVGNDIFSLLDIPE